jgi:hypothetical protein
MDCRFVTDAGRDRRFSFVQAPLSKTMGVFFVISCLWLDAHSTYSFRMQMHVMNALKGADLFNSHKLCTSLLIMIPLTCHSGFQPTKHGRSSKRSGEHRRPADAERG